MIQSIIRNILVLSLLISALRVSAQTEEAHVVDESRFITRIVDPADGDLHMYWKDEAGKPYGSIERLRDALEIQDETLVFAMNGGMYLKDQSPQGLYIEGGEVLRPLDTQQEAFGNFYLQPNGIFYLTAAGEAHVVKTLDFKMDPSITYATQSGPMLLIDGAYHPKLMKGSTNLHIRNAVGILPDGRVLFAISKKETKFYDLATLFKQHGCTNALYLDGFVSRMYLPSAQWEQTDGRFGVIIGEVGSRE